MDDHLLTYLPLQQQDLVEKGLQCQRKFQHIQTYMTMLNGSLQILLLAWEDEKGIHLMDETGVKPDMYQ